MRNSNLIGRCVAVAAVLYCAPAKAAENAPVSQVGDRDATVSGVPLGAAWKQKIYNHARKHFGHPAWGWTHSERDYRLALALAAKERLAIDTDILFAAAFLHDAGAIDPFAREGIDHAVRSVELAEPLLRDAGFPMEKFPGVRAAILTHMFDKDPGANPEAVVLHDADTLDFLGAMGAARALATTGPAPSFEAGVAQIEQFADVLPPRLVTPTAKKSARARVREMRQFMKDLRAEAATVPF